MVKNHFPFLVLLTLLASCKAVIDVRNAGVTAPLSVCARLQEALNGPNYCALAATHANVTAEGAGTVEDPHQLCSPYQVNAIGTNVPLVERSYKLGADIDMSCISGNHSSIGSSTTPFSGNFDGNGKTIAHWRRVEAGVDYVGFFGQVGGPSVRLIKDVTFTDAEVSGNNYVGILGGAMAWALVSGVRTTGTVSGNNNVGGLSGNIGIALQTSTSSATVSGAASVGGLVGSVGHPEIASSSFSGTVTATGNGVGGIVGVSGSTVYNSYNTGTVTSSGNNVGGLAGQISHGIENSFNTGAVSGGTGVGGLVGNLPLASPVAELTNSFSTGNVTGRGGSAASVGLLVGSNAGAATNSYYLATAACDADVLTVGTQACGTTATGTVPLLADFYSSATAPLSSWDFQGTAVDGSDDFWEERTSGLPVAWNEAPEIFNPPFAGSGTDDDPYLITSVAEFNAIGKNHRLMSASFRLMADLDFTASTFRQIGGGEGSFLGTFDGNNHALANMTLAKKRAFTGVFGFAVATIRDLTVTNGNFDTDRLFSGVLVGWLYGSVSNCHTSGQADGSYYTGGLVDLLFGSVSDSTSSASIVTVSSTANGGAVGMLNGTVARSSASGPVTGAAFSGGLVGRLNAGSVSDSYATGVVNSVAINFPQYYGGLAGSMSASTTISNSYATGAVNGRSSTGGLVGLVGAGATITNSFSTGDVTGMSNSTQVGRLVGTSTATVTHSYYLASSACDAHSGTAGVQACNTTATGSVAALSDFYSVLTTPLDQWDFTTVWDSDAASLPVLR